MPHDNVDMSGKCGQPSKPMLCVHAINTARSLQRNDESTLSNKLAASSVSRWRAHRTVKSFEIRLCRHVRVVATRRRSLDSRRQMTKLLYGSPQRPPYRQNRVRTINLTSIIFRHPLPATTFSGFLHVRLFSGQYYTQGYCKVLKYAEVASRNCLLLFTKVIERADCTVIQNVDHLIIHSIL